MEASRWDGRPYYKHMQQAPSIRAPAGRHRRGAGAKRGRSGLWPRSSSCSALWPRAGAWDRCLSERLQGQAREAEPLCALPCRHQAPAFLTQQRPRPRPIFYDVLIFGLVLIGGAAALPQEIAAASRREPDRARVVFWCFRLRWRVGGSRALGPEVVCGIVFWL